MTDYKKIRDFLREYLREFKFHEYMRVLEYIYQNQSILQGHKNDAEVLQRARGMINTLWNELVIIEDFTNNPLVKRCSLEFESVQIIANIMLVIIPIQRSFDAGQPLSNDLINTISFEIHKVKEYVYFFKTEPDETSDQDDEDDY